MLNQTKLIKFPKIDDNTGWISVFSKVELPFEIIRLFTVHTNVDCIRGHHAHKKCNQLLVCLSGSCLVTIKDGINKKRFKLEYSNKGLYIPAGIWAEQKYVANSLVIVFTDQLYDESDYIRNYSDFLKFKENIK
jgi:dTDP-4-dehydrorhamnose 3,5-epimerase-like enzyme